MPRVRHAGAPYDIKRRLLNLLTLLSLLLSVSAAVLWVRSYMVSDEVGWVKWMDKYSLRSYLGGIHAAWSRDDLFRARGYFRSAVQTEMLFDDPDLGKVMDLPPHWSDRYLPANRSWECCGFAAAAGQRAVFGLWTGPADPDEGRFAVLVVPCWFIVLPET